nr:helix-turn-helix transcriptional regulator [uncultured Solibaculum sp.]
MKIDNKKLDLLLAQRCMNLRDLRQGTSPQTLTRIRRGEEVLPATVGRIAKALEVDPADLIAEEE